MKTQQTVKIKPLQTVKELRLSAHSELDNLKTAHLKREGTSSHLESTIVEDLIHAVQTGGT